MSREDAFCAETILGDQPFVVPDAAAAPRFSGSSLTHQGFRFYAGAPLVDSRSGQGLGAVCVVDTAPRRMLDDGERGVLAEFARIAMTVIERGRPLPALEDDERESARTAA